MRRYLQRRLGRVGRAGERVGTPAVVPCPPQLVGGACDEVDFEFVRETLAGEASRKLNQLSELATDIDTWLDDAGPNAANAVTEALDVSAYHVQESLTELEEGE